VLDALAGGKYIVQGMALDVQVRRGVDDGRPVVVQPVGL